MKTERNILIAFILNLSFSVLEFFGGLLTGSVAILSDSLHDLGDAASIGISWLLERKSLQKADDSFTYGYSRFSVLGGLITTTILIIGSILVTISAVSRLIHPVTINYNGMIILAVAGTVLNLAAAFVTRKGNSINQKSVNLHMLEDVLGWIVVLIGAVIMRFTDLRWIDPLMSIGVSVFILIHALKNLREICEIFLEKVPAGIDIQKLKNELETIEGVTCIRHIHIWSLDGNSHCATMQISIAQGVNTSLIKKTVREKLLADSIVHAVLELDCDGCEENGCIL